MVIDMESGKRIDDDFGAFGEEVLNAQWLPPLAPELCLQQLRLATVAETSEQSLDAEAFLRTVYMNQE